MITLSDIRLQKCCDHQDRVRGPSRSLEISPFDRARMTLFLLMFYRVTMALSRVDSEIFNVEKYSDLDISVRVSQGH